MDLSEIINDELIILDLDAGTKTEAINTLSGRLLETGRIGSIKNFLDSVYDRERTEPTDMGIGVAIPHGKTDAVIKPSVVIGKLRRPISWTEDPDPASEPIYAIFLMASPEQADGYLHLEIISKIAALLIDDEFIEILKHTQEKTSLLHAIHTMIGEM